MLDPSDCIPMIFFNETQSIVEQISLGQALRVFWAGGVGGREPGHFKLCYRERDDNPNSF